MADHWGYFQQLTGAEELFVQNLAALPYQDGDILYYDNGAIQRLPIGSADEVLKVASGLPSWGSGGGTIGGTIVGGTQGSVLFLGAAGVLAQDNANFFWDDTNNRLGIGTATPNASLNIKKASSVANQKFASFTIGSNEIAFIGESSIPDYGGIISLKDGLGGAGYLNLEYSQGYGRVNTSSQVFSFIGSGYQIRMTNAYIDFTVGGGVPLYLDPSSVGIFEGAPGARFQVTGTSSTRKVAIFKAAASQTANLTEWQNSVATAQALIRPDGGFYSNGPATDTLYSGNALTGNYSFAGGQGYWAMRTGSAFDFNLDHYNTAGTPINSLKITRDGKVTFNDGGLDADFNIEGDTNANLFYVDASTDRIGIKTNAPSTELQIDGTNPAITLRNGSSNGVITYTSGNVLTLNAGGSYVMQTSGTSRLTISADGLVTISGFPSNGKGLIVKNAAAQTENPIEVQNSSGTAYITVGPSTLAGDSLTKNFLTVTGTLASTNTAEAAGVNINVTGAGSSAFGQNAMYLKLTNGYSGSLFTIGLQIQNLSLATGTNWISAIGNFGFYANTSGTTTGTNVGGYGFAQNGDVSIGFVGNATTAKNSGKNIGVIGIALNTGTTPTQVGGFFGLMNAAPTFASAALMADNGGTTSNIFVARDNGSAVFTIADGGAVTATADITVPDEAYGAGWNGSLEVPTKNAVYDKIEAIVVGGGGATTALDNLASVAINTSLISDTDNTDALGSATIGWSDLFLGTGAVINFVNGDVTLTHSADTLTLAGGVLVLPDTGLTIGVSVPFSDSAGTLTLQNIDALDATTEATIEAAIDTLANLTSIQGRTVTLADAGANAIFGWDDAAGAYENLTQAEARTVLGLGSAALVATDLADLNEATIEGAIDTLANLTSIQGLTVTLADAGEDAILGWDDSVGAYENLTQAEGRTVLGLGSAALVATDLADLNEATIEAAIDTLANLTSVQGHTVTLTGAFIRSGAHSLTLTTLGVTNVTLPASGTLAILGGNVFTGVHDFGGATSLEIPNGAGGTTVNDAGEICIDTTSKTFNFYEGAAERVLNPILSKSITIESPTAAEDISLFYTDDAITITKIVFVITGATSVTTTVRHHTDRNNAGNEVVTGGTVANNSTTGNVVTSFNDATVPADSFLWIETTALSGTPTSVNITIFYTQDP